MNMRYTSFAVVIVVLSGMIAGAGEPNDAALPSRERFHLFLLVGQSNMAGRGRLAAQDREVHPRVLMFNKEDRWVPAVDPIHFDKPNVVGVGLGRTFGTEIAEASPEITVGLIPCAVGGSPIASWEPGGYHESTKSHPYDNALRRASQALKSGVLKAVLWHQGESDSQPGKAEVYEQKLQKLIVRCRTALAVPGVPFLVGQMGQFPERPWNDAKQLVDSVQRNLAQKVSQYAFVNSDGLAHKGDQVHFDAKSYRELGRRYALAYREMTNRRG